MSGTYRPKCSKEFRVCLMEVGCFCPCPQHESEGSRSVDSIYSATRCDAFISTLKIRHANTVAPQKSLLTLLQTSFDFHSLLCVIQLVVLSLMSVNHHVPGLIADNRSIIFFFMAESSLIACILFQYNVLISVGFKICFLTKIIIISINPLVIIINHGFIGCAIKLHDFTT